MKDRHKPEYRRPRTGEQRRTRQPLKIDRLPAEWKEQIAGWLRAHSVDEVIELTKSLPWDKADARIRQLFPKRYVPEGNLYRYRDLRLDQADRRIDERMKVTQRIVKKWSEIGLKNLPEAVKNKLADLAFEIEQYSSEGNEKGVEKSLVELGWLLSDLRKSEVAAAKLELEKEKLDTRRQAMAATSPREVYLAATEELLKKLRTRKDVRAVLDPISKELIEELSKSAEAFAKRIEAQSA